MRRQALLLPLIVLILSGSASMLRADEKPATRPAVQKIDVERFDEMRQEKDSAVLDVRSPGEFAKGHVPGAVNLNVDDPAFNKAVSDLDKSRTYLVHCARGVRSARAAARMAQMGFEHLYDFSGGFDGWKKAGKPVAK